MEETHPLLYVKGCLADPTPGYPPDTQEGIPISIYILICLKDVILSLIVIIPT